MFVNVVVGVGVNPCDGVYVGVANGVKVIVNVGVGVGGRPNLPVKHSGTCDAPATYKPLFCIKVTAYGEFVSTW